MELIELILELFNLVKSVGKEKSHPWKQNSKYQNFHKLLNAKTIDIDSSAKLLGYKSKNDRTFIRFLQRYEEKLLIIAMSIDPVQQQSSLVSKWYIQVIQYYSVGFLFKFRNRINASIHYFKKSFQLAEKSFFTQYQYLNSFELYKRYSTSNFNVKQQLFYFKKLNECQTSLMHEVNVVSLERGLINLVSKNVNQKILLEKAKDTYNKIKIIREESFTPTIYHSSFQIEVFYLNLSRNFDEIQTACSAYEKAFKKRKIHNYTTRFFSYKAQLEGLIGQSKFTKARLFLENESGFLRKDSQPYLRNMTLYFKILVQLEEYKSCMDLTKKAMNLKLMKLDRKLNELWLIRQGYLHLIAELGIDLGKSSDKVRLSQYRMNKLLNQIEYYTKDKTGLNAGLRILELSFFIARKMEDNIIDRVEAVRQYAYRYLRSDDTLRLKIFLRFLIICHDQNYKVKAIERHSADLRKRLEQNPLEIKDSVVEAEIIPFERLWDYMLDFIGNNYSQKA